MGVFGRKPEERLQNHLGAATQELRTFIGNTLISGNTRELDRVTRYHLFWNFYEGKHYKDFNDNMLTFNYIKAFIDKVNLFLLGDKGFTLKVISYYNDVVPEEVEKNAEDILLRNWRMNNYRILTHELLQMGSICGDAWVGVSWDNDRKYTKIELYDSRQCFPIFENGDYNKLESFTIRQTLDDKNSDFRVLVTKFTKDAMITWKQKSSAEYVSSRDMFDLKTQDHEFGFIPVVHFKNKPQSNSYYSKSDAHDILKINKIYNELNQEIKSIIDYYATPTTVVTGASIKNIKRGLGNVWSGLPPEANVFNLGLDVDLSAATTFAEKLKLSMHEISDVPESVLGKQQSISGTSAAALKLTYQPLVQQADLKALTYGEGISQINELILKFYKKYKSDDERFKKLPTTFLEDFKCEPIFAYGFPTDRMNTLQELSMEKGMLLTTRRDALNRLGVNNVIDFIAEIDDERVRGTKLQKMLNKLLQPDLTAGDQPNPPPPPTDVDEIDTLEEIAGM